MDSELCIAAPVWTERAINSSGIPPLPAAFTTAAGYFISLFLSSSFTFILSLFPLLCSPFSSILFPFVFYSFFPSNLSCCSFFPLPLLSPIFPLFSFSRLFLFHVSFLSPVFPFFLSTLFLFSPSFLSCIPFHRFSAPLSFLISKRRK